MIHSINKYFLTLSFLSSFFLSSHGGVLLASSVNELNHLGTTSLNTAAFKGDLKRVKNLLESKADPLKSDIYGDSPLHNAALNNNSFCIEALLLAGANPLAINRDGEKPLDIAISTSSFAAIKVLEKVTTKGLLRSASLGLIQRVKESLALGADIEGANDLGSTALHEAAYNGHEPIVKYLLSSKASPSTKDMFGDTPLHVAALNGKAQCLPTLLYSKANLNIRNTDGEKPKKVALNEEQDCCAMILDWFEKSR